MVGEMTSNATHNTPSTVSFYGIINVSTIPDRVYGAKWRNWVKLERERKVWYPVFPCFLSAIAEVKFIEGGLGTRLCVHPNFSNIS